MFAKEAFTFNRHRKNRLTYVSLHLCIASILTESKFISNLQSEKSTVKANRGDLDKICHN